jgi:uncharacterized protein YndB with AHSA1/START domain
MATEPDFHFLTRWDIPAPIDRVWAEILDVESWPQWWPGVLEVTSVARGDDNGVGSIVDTVWKSALPFKLKWRGEIVEVVPHERIGLTAEGELVGSGLWTFQQTPDGTHVEYRWDVSSGKWLFRTLTPVARKSFTKNHDTIMEWGHQGLLGRLGVTSTSVG